MPESRGSCSGRGHKPENKCGYRLLTLDWRSLARMNTRETPHRLGIDRGHISEIESGKKNVCLPMLEVLAEGFKMTLSELMKDI